MNRDKLINGIKCNDSDWYNAERAYWSGNQVRWNLRNAIKNHPAAPLISIPFMFSYYRNQILRRFEDLNPGIIESASNVAQELMLKLLDNNLALFDAETLMH